MYLHEDHKQELTNSNGQKVDANCHRQSYLKRPNLIGQQKMEVISRSRSLQVQHQPTPNIYSRKQAPALNQYGVTYSEKKIKSNTASRRVRNRMYDDDAQGRIWVAALFGLVPK